MIGLARLVRIELLKLGTTRTGYGLLGVAAVLTALDAVLRAARAGNGNRASLSTAAGLSAVCTVTGFAMLMAIVLGAIVASGEFWHATATLTYLEFPDRGRVLVAKALAAGLCGLAFGAVGSGIASGVGLIFVAGHGYGIAVAGPTLTRYALGAVLGAGLLAALGVALGSLVRSQLAVVVGLLVWALFIEPILGGLFNTISPFLPFTASTTLAGARLGGGGFGFAGSNSAAALPFSASAALVAAVVLAVVGVGACTTVSADIS